MIIFLYGQDSYRAQEKLSEIIAHYKEVRKSGLNLIDVDAGKTDFSQVYDVLKISSMFAETKLVTLKNVFSGKSFQEDFLKELKLLQSLKDVIVVFENDVVDQRLKLFKLLLKECKSQEFALLDSKNLKIWAQKEFEKLKAKINNDALDALLSCTRNDLWRLFNEIKKLVDFKDGQVVRKEDVQMLVKPNIETDIFKTKKIKSRH